MQDAWHTLWDADVIIILHSVLQRVPRNPSMYWSMNSTLACVDVLLLCLIKCCRESGGPAGAQICGWTEVWTTPWWDLQLQLSLNLLEVDSALSLCTSLVNSAACDFCCMDPLLLLSAIDNWLATCSSAHISSISRLLLLLLQRTMPPQWSSGVSISLLGTPISKC